MCGIVGFTGQNSKGTLKNMMDAIYYRGPDDSGMWFNSTPPINLGHRRLSIIDIKSGSQPMTESTGRYTIVYNGEIYNHSELRKELLDDGYIFMTDHSDTEVILNGYAKWGNELPKMLNGMWAFAIYDKEKRLLFISRDRFGQKPFYYYYNGRVLIFSSELHAILRHPDVQTNKSKLNMQKYFAYGYIPAPNTLYNNIYKLPAGYNIQYDCSVNTLKTEQYWDFELDPFPKNELMSENEMAEELRMLLEMAVKRRMVSDVPVGIFLSGGIDSSAITAYASNLGNRKINSFSIGFKEESFDETSYSSYVAKFFNTNHHSEVFSSERALEIIPEVLSKLDEPMGDSSLLPTYMLSKMTRQHVTVALAGDGADELFAGYDPFLALKYARIYDSIIPKTVHSAIYFLANKIPVSHRNISLDFKIKRTLRGLNYNERLWNSIWLGPLSPNELNDLFDSYIDIEEVYEEAINTWDSCKQSNIVDKTLQFYTKLYLQDDILVKADRASMLNSLEVRAPFLDINLVNFVRRIPANLKLKNGVTKYILKKSLEPVLTNKILYRKKKGFGIPIGEWLANSKVPVSTEQIPYLSNNYISKKYNDHLSQTSDNRAFLWNHLVLSQNAHESAYINSKL